VHPANALERAASRPDIPVGLDWRFCDYRYENASRIFNNTISLLKLIEVKSSKEQNLNDNMQY
jgi:hypothetical protein